MFDFFNSSRKIAHEIKEIVIYAQYAENNIKGKKIQKAINIIETKIINIEKKILKHTDKKHLPQIKKEIVMWKDVLDILKTKTNYRDALIYIQHMIKDEENLKKEILQK